MASAKTLLVCLYAALRSPSLVLFWNNQQQTSPSRTSLQAPFPSTPRESRVCMVVSACMGLSQRGCFRRNQRAVGTSTVLRVWGPPPPCLCSNRGVECLCSSCPACCLYDIDIYVATRYAVPTFAECQRRTYSLYHRRHRTHTHALSQK